MHTKVGTWKSGFKLLREENQEIQTTAFDAAAAAGAGEEDVEITETLEDRSEDSCKSMAPWNSIGRRPLRHTLARLAALSFSPSKRSTFVGHVEFAIDEIMG